MKTCIRRTAVHSGFTLIELMVVLIILGIIISIAIPAFSSWLPDYRLRSVTQELYSNMYLAKIKAIKNNNKYRIVFATSGSGSYELQLEDGTVEKTIDFLDYDPNGSVGYGGGDATKSATTSGGSMPGDFVSYSYNKVTFNPQGMGSSGYVYLANSKGTAYAIGTWSSGVIVLKKWNEATNSWE